MEITQVRYKTGVGFQTGCVCQVCILQYQPTSVPQLEAGINQYITTLAILLRTYPQDLRPTLEQNGKLPDYMEPVGIGIPADLLLRRPDIRQAERQINAQAALPVLLKAIGCRRFSWVPVGYSSP